MKVSFIIYADLESLLEKMSICHNNPEKLSTTKISKHTPSGGEDFMKELCKNLKEYVTKIINYEKKEIIPLTKEVKKTHHRQKKCCICNKRFSTDDDDKEHHKVKDHCHYTGKYRAAAHNICNLRYKVPKEIPVVFHNGGQYDYHFIVKELAEEFKGKFECFCENTEKYITFSVLIKKEIDDGKSIIYKIKFIDSFRFMLSSLSNLVDNLSEGLHSDRCTDCKNFY